jgi:hypothetical protein
MGFERGVWGIIGSGAQVKELLRSINLMWWSCCTVSSGGNLDI